MTTIMKFQLELIRHSLNTSKDAKICEKCNLLTKSMMSDHTNLTDKETDIFITISDILDADSKEATIDYINGVINE